MKPNFGSTCNTVLYSKQTPQSKDHTAGIQYRGLQDHLFRLLLTPACLIMLAKFCSALLWCSTSCAPPSNTPLHQQILRRSSEFPNTCLNWTFTTIKSWHCKQCVPACCGKQIFGNTILSRCKKWSSWFHQITSLNLQVIHCGCAAPTDWW